MTRDEIIATLKKHRAFKWWSGELEEALNIAITELSRRPTVEEIRVYCEGRWDEYVFGDDDWGEPLKAEAYQDVVRFIEEGK